MSELSIETKDFLIDCISRNTNSYSDASIDTMIELNHMCREVNRVYEKEHGYKKWTYPLFDYRKKKLVEDFKRNLYKEGE